MSRKRKKFEFPANPEFFNCEDANEDVSYGNYDDVINGFATNESDKEVVTHVNLNNYIYLKDELGYTDKQFEDWNLDHDSVSEFCLRKPTFSIENVSESDIIDYIYKEC